MSQDALTAKLHRALHYLYKLKAQFQRRNRSARLDELLADAWGPKEQVEWLNKSQG